MRYDINKIHFSMILKDSETDIYKIVYPKILLM